MAMSILPLLILLLVLLGGVAGVVLIVLGLRGRGGDAADSGTCGKCGYMVRGISTLQCPECGADLRETGIQPSGRTSRKGMLIAGIALVVVCFGCTCFSALGIWVTVSPSQQPQVQTHPIPVHPPQAQPAPTPAQPSP